MHQKNPRVHRTSTVKKKKAQNEIRYQKEGENFLLVKALMLSALPNLFLIRCANSLGFDITVLKKKQAFTNSPLQWEKQITHNSQQTAQHIP
jgi:uncharacterized protein YmfQ (DUF2313 family)